MNNCWYYEVREPNQKAALMVVMARGRLANDAVLDEFPKQGGDPTGKQVDCVDTIYALSNDHRPLAEKVLAVGLEKGESAVLWYYTSYAPDHTVPHAR